MKNPEKNRFYKNKFLLAGAVISALCPISAMAQSVPDAATTSASPARAEEQFKASQTTPDISPRVEVKDMIAQKAPEGAEKISFNLKSINLNGVTAYPEAELQTIYADQVGQTITLLDLYKVANDLTKKYRNDGYVLTQVVVPPQTIDGGDVELRVVEGFIDTISVEGPQENESELNLIRQYVNEIRTGQVLNIKDLERYLLLIGDLPGVTARSVLSPSQTTVGAADLRIIVERDPYDLYLAADNYGSRYLGPLQITASGAINSLFGLNERTTLQLVGAPDPSPKGPLELGYVALGYEQPLPFIAKGALLNIYTSYTDTEPGYTLSQFDVEGISKYISARVSYPFIRSRTTNLNGYISMDARNISSRSNIQDTLHDKIRAVRVGGSYEFLDTWLGIGVNAINFELSQGLDILSASDHGDDNLTRTRGEPKFTKATAEVQRLQKLTSDLNLLVAAKGQWSANSLLSSEEFGVGGTSYGRGYDASEVVGDDGMVGKVELQWNNPYQTDIFNDYQLFGFYDAGKIWNRDATTQDNDRETLTSAGLGMRAEFLNDINADFMMAVPLNKNVQTEGDQNPRFFLSVSREF